MGKLHYTEYNKLFGKIRNDKGWFSDFMKLCREYYMEHCTGGSLHIVLDDGNLAKHHIDWSAGYACGANDEAGSDIANLMRNMTMKQKRKVYKNYALYGYGQLSSVVKK